MKGLLIVCLLISLVYVAFTAKSPGPLFMWSDKEIFRASRINVGYANSDAVGELLACIVGFKNENKGSLHKYLNKDVPVPEAILLFLKPHLTSSKFSVWANVYNSKQKNGGALANLKNLYENSKSSLSIHYSYLKESFAEDVLKQFVAELQESHPDSKSVLFSQSKSDDQHFPLLQHKWISLDKAEEYLVSGEGKELLKDGNPNLLIFYFSSDETHEIITGEDSIMGSITNVVNIATDHNYLAIYSSDVPEAHTYNSISSNEKQNIFLRSSNSFIMNPAATNSSDVAGTYFPPQMWQAIFASLIIIVALSIGLSCTMGLQTPPKLLDEAMAKKKNK